MTAAARGESLPLLTYIGLGSIILIGGTLMFAHLAVLLAEYGALRYEGAKFRTVLDDGHRIFSNQTFVDVTYGRVLRWIAEGLFALVTLLLWRMWPTLLRSMLKSVAVLFVGLWRLVKIIHSNERVLCAIDGTLGGVIAYALLIGPERSLVQNAIAVLFGEVLGAGWVSSTTRSSPSAC